MINDAAFNGMGTCSYEYFCFCFYSLKELIFYCPAALAINYIKKECERAYFAYIYIFDIVIKCKFGGFNSIHL